MEAEFVPRLNHSRLEVEIVCDLLRHSDGEGTASGVDSFGRIVLVIACGAIVEIDGLLERIIAWPEGTALLLELVGKDEMVRSTVSSRDACEGRWRGVGVNESEKRQVGNLTRAVGATEVEASLVGCIVELFEMRDDGVAGKEGDKTDN